MSSAYSIIPTNADISNSSLSTWKYIATVGITATTIAIPHFANPVTHTNTSVRYEEDVETQQNINVISNALPSTNTQVSIGEINIVHGIDNELPLQNKFEPISLFEAKNVSKAHSSDIIIDKEEEKEGVEMLDRLIESRNRYERLSIIGGLVLGTLIITPSLFSILEWAVTIPAALVAYSITGYALIRKATRRFLNES